MKKESVSGIYSSRLTYITFYIFLYTFYIFVLSVFDKQQDTFFHGDFRSPAGKGFVADRALIF